MERSHQKKLRLLVIEDEGMIAMELSDLLEDLGHTVVGMARSPGQALRLIAKCTGGVDAAMLDANLGSQSSLPVAEALRRAGVPFIVTSGYDPDELRRLGYGEARIQKPYTRSDIEQSLVALG